MIRVPPEVHEALAHPATEWGGDLQARAGLALLPVVVLQRVIEDHATSLPDEPVRALRGALVLLIGVGALVREYGLRRGAGHARELGGLVRMAEEVDAARADLERRRAAFDPAGHAAARGRLDALAARWRSPFPRQRSPSATAASRDGAPGRRTSAACSSPTRTGSAARPGCDS